MATTDSSVLFSRNVATLLRVSGMSKKELADLCELPPPRITEIIQAKYSQNLKTVDRVCQAFNQHFGDRVITPSALIAEHFEIPAKIFADSA